LIEISEDLHVMTTDAVAGDRSEAMSNKADILPGKGCHPAPSEIPTLRRDA